MVLNVTISDSTVKTLFDHIREQYPFKTLLNRREILNIDVHPKEGDAVALTPYEKFTLSKKASDVELRKYDPFRDDPRHFILVNVTKGKGLSTKDKDPLTGVKNVYFHVQDYNKFTNIPLWFRVPVLRAIFYGECYKNRDEISKIMSLLNRFIEHKTLPFLANILLTMEQFNMNSYSFSNRNEPIYAALDVFCGYMRKFLSNPKRFDEWLDFIDKNDYCNPNLYFDRNKLMTLFFGENWTKEVSDYAPECLQPKVLELKYGYYPASCQRKINLESTQNSTLFKKVDAFMRDMPENFAKAYGFHALLSNEETESYPMVALSYLYHKRPEMLEHYNFSDIGAVLSSTNKDWKAICDILRHFPKVEAYDKAENAVFTSIIGTLDFFNSQPESVKNASNETYWLAPSSYIEDMRFANKLYDLTVSHYANKSYIKLSLDAKDSAKEAVEGNYLVKEEHGVDSFVSLNDEDTETMRRIDEYYQTHDYDANLAMVVRKTLSMLFFNKRCNDNHYCYYCEGKLYNDYSDDEYKMPVKPSRNYADTTVFHILEHLILSSVREASKTINIPEALILQRFATAYDWLLQKEGDRLRGVVRRTYLEVYSNKNSNEEANLSIALICLLNSGNPSIFNMPDEFLSEQIKVILAKMLNGKNRASNKIQI